MKRILALAMAVMVAASVFLFAGSVKVAAAEDTLVLATSAEFPPYEFIQGNDFAGIDIEIGEIIAERLGRELKVENMPFTSVINSVQTGKADIGMAGITVTEDRKKSVIFSDTYTDAVQVIVVPKDSPIKSVDDIYAEDAAYKFGVQLSTTGDIYISDEINGENKTLNGAVEQYATGAEAIMALKAGKIDCVVIDNEPAKNFVRANTELKILDTEYVREEYAACFSKDNTELCAQVNTILADLKADGTIDKIIEKYINDDTQTVEHSYTGLRGVWEDLKSDFLLNFIEDNRWMYIVDGLTATLQITALAAIVGIFIGVIVAIIRSTYDKNSSKMYGVGKLVLKLLNLISKIYLTVIRGTPVILQLLIMYFVIFASSQNKIMVAVIAFGINSGAYVAEIFRSGIMSIDGGQMEAGRSLGLNYTQTMLYIIIPQAFKTVLPTLANEFIVLLKETSVVGYIGMMDLTRAGDMIRGVTFTAFMPLIAVALIYLIIVMILTKLVALLERRLRNSER